MNIGFIMVGIVVLLCVVLLACVCLKARYGVSIASAVAGVLCIMAGIYLFSATAWWEIAIGCLCIGIVFIAISIAVFVKKQVSVQ